MRDPNDNTAPLPVVMMLAENPQPFFVVNADRKSITADWSKIRELAEKVQNSPPHPSFPLEQHEVLALALWLVRKTTYDECLPVDPPTAAPEVSH